MSSDGDDDWANTKFTIDENDEKINRVVENQDSTLERTNCGIASGAEKIGQNCRNVDLEDNTSSDLHQCTDVRKEIVEPHQHDDMQQAKVKLE